MQRRSFSRIAESQTMRVAQGSETHSVWGQLERSSGALPMPPSSALIIALRANVIQQRSKAHRAACAVRPMSAFRVFRPKADGQKLQAQGEAA